jgi:thiamine biosynthesis protein ThiI
VERKIVVHYSEIGLKGKNREYFERLLVRNIRKKGGKARRKYGRIEVEFEEGIEEKLKKIPGIRYIGSGFKTSLDIEEINAASLSSLPKSFNTFCVKASRGYKDFHLNSIEINREVGSFIQRRSKKAVDLKNPDVTIRIEIYQDSAYVYTRRIDGVGGLPAGSAGRVVSLLSGGIDSPVASFMAMKRGCEVVLSHFFNSTIHSAEVRKKILLLAEKLSEFHSIRLYMIPFEDIQMEIIRTVPSKLRMVVYRRSMMRMANLVADREGAKAIITGDSLSQVASQTLENLNVIHSASDRLVLSPLLGFDKEEIIQKAKEIGTYEISILPYEDCCTLMVAKHPETRAKVEEISQYESYEEMEELAVSRAEVFEYG